MSHAAAGQPSGESSAFQVTVGELRDGVVSVEVTGAVDLLTAPRVGEALEQAQQGSPKVLLDLRKVEFMGSAGLSVLVDAVRRAGETHGRLAMVTTEHAVLRAVQVTGLDSVLRIFSGVDDADGYLQG